MRPAAAAVVSLNLPSNSDAKFKRLTKCQKANIHSPFCYVNLIKSPTRLPEDPKENMNVNENTPIEW
jgi:hypothetical protein